MRRKYVISSQNIATIDVYVTDLEFRHKSWRQIEISLQPFANVSQYHNFGTKTYQICKSEPVNRDPVTTGLDKTCGTDSDKSGLVIIPQSG